MGLGDPIGIFDSLKELRKVEEAVLEAEFDFPSMTRGVGFCFLFNTVGFTVKKFTVERNFFFSVRL